MFEKLLIVLLLIGFFSLFLKIYFHFLYYKIVEKYEINITDFFRGVFKYFWPQKMVLLPIFLRLDESELNKQEKQEVLRIKRLIYIFLSITWLGIISLIAGVYLYKK